MAFRLRPSHTQLYLSIYLYAYVCMYACMYVCMYIYIYKGGGHIRSGDLSAVRELFARQLPRWRCWASVTDFTTDFTSNFTTNFTTTTYWPLTLLLALLIILPLTYARQLPRSSQQSRRFAISRESHSPHGRGVGRQLQVLNLLV